ncbi:hypothetical protein L207DRAFT_580958 [Hyaloscypha variabilis F]|uniref:Uncharacterized protein n=1 Tax=Hyaloscypha variabilis (strain UAMH 11265 / GT02V1 / F) TaxID=1149755 RepID=A0A2J6RUU1_HYAVF|nr:hypothetical protein L207DRAFT_580958 [Hyaloscypha variabilis F]
MSYMLFGVGSDADYGQPGYLVHAGELYSLTAPAISLSEFEAEHGYIPRMVVVFQQPLDGDFDECEEGPDFITFNSAVYQKSPFTQPYTIHDDTLRTVEAGGRLYESPGPSPQDFYGNAPSYYEHSFSSSTAQADTRVRFQVEVPTKRTMASARPKNSKIKPLQFLFDVPVEHRAAIQVIEPTFHNPPIPVRPGQKKPRFHWTVRHHEHLFNLIEVAVSQLQRPLEHIDFKAITEALHRQFRGTTSLNDQPYLERGYSTVHTYATRKQQYVDLLNRLLP